jgi:hypothetical protein
MRSQVNWNWMAQHLRPDRLGARSRRRVAGVGGSARRGTRSTRKPGATDSVAVRAWARENGYDIKDRGRVPAEVVAKYRQAAGQ